MKRRTKSATIPANYMKAWEALFRRPPEELEDQRRASSPAMAGSRKAPISAPQSTQTTGALPMPHLRKEPKL